MSLRPPYLYPLRGIFYLLSHPTLWNRICHGLILMILMSVLSSILLLVFAFPSQAHLLDEHMSTWIAWILSFFLTLIEIGTAVLVFSSIFLSYYMNIIFDAVWRQETVTINQGHAQRVSSNGFSCIKSFLVLILFRVLLIVITCPLNLIPICGTMLYIYINGYYYAWSLHCRYFDLLGLTFAQGKHFVEQNQSDYRKFGIVAILLEMIFLLNIITPVTNVIGSALWACDIERFKEPLEHPRSYLLSPNPTLLEQVQVDYGATKFEKEPPAPPSYQDVVQNQIYPSAPPDEKQ